MNDKKKIGRTKFKAFTNPHLSSLKYKKQRMKFQRAIEFKLNIDVIKTEILKCNTQLFEILRFK